MKKGSLEVICGSMFSGKTEELMRRLRRAEYAKQNVLTIKHCVDTRKSVNCIVSHNDQQREAITFDGSPNSIKNIIALANESNVIAFDEIQFFPKQIQEVIISLINLGKRIIVTGLDLDFRGEPFGIVPTLMAFADEITKLKAICVKCGRDAHHSQRILNGKPAKYNDPVIMVGAEECYEARCKNCFEIDIQSKLKSPK